MGENMKIAGLNIIQVLGLANLVLVLFQVLSGFRVIRVSFAMHRRTGTALLVCALLHAIFAFMAS